MHKRYLLHVAGHNLSLLMRQLIGAGTPREAVAGGYGGIFVLLTPTGAMLVARGLAKRPDGFRRRIPHLGVRAEKSHLIIGLVGDDRRSERKVHWIGLACLTSAPMVRWWQTDQGDRVAGQAVGGRR